VLAHRATDGLGRCAFSWGSFGSSMEMGADESIWLCFGVVCVGCCGVRRAPPLLHAPWLWPDEASCGWPLWS
jgi:hypothetical protein